MILIILISIVFLILLYKAYKVLSFIDEHFTLSLRHYLELTIEDKRRLVVAFRDAITILQDSKTYSGLCYVFDSLPGVTKDTYRTSLYGLCIYYLKANRPLKSLLKIAFNYYIRPRTFKIAYMWKIEDTESRIAFLEHHIDKLEKDIALYMYKSKS